MAIEKQEIKCPVCNFDGSKEYLTKSFEKFKSTWLRCGKCWALFISPFPTLKELKEYYRFNYKSRKSPGEVSHCFRFSEENKNTIFNEYQLSLFDIGVPVNMLQNRKILDYGCANGLFLDFCFENDCLKEDLFGFDIAEDLLKEVREKDYNIFNGEKNYFDYIFLWDVLEHISDPRDFLQGIKLYLKNRSELIVQTPRAGVLSDLLKDKWEHFLPYEHVVIYTRESLVELFRDAGFHLIRSGSFGANAPSNIIPQPYKNTFDSLVKQTDNGVTQVARFIFEK